MERKKSYFSIKLIVTICFVCLFSIATNSADVQAKALAKVQGIAVENQQVEVDGAQVITGFQLSWNAVEGCAGYEIYSYGVASKKWRSIGTTKETGYVVTNFMALSQQKIKVRAYTGSKKKKYGKYSKVVVCKASNAVCPLDANGAVAKDYTDRGSAEMAFELQNKLRKKGKASKIKWSEGLYELCKIRVKQLPKDFSHNKYKKESKKFLKKKYGIKDRYTYIKKKGVNYGVLLIGAENIQFGGKDYKEAVDIWKHSKGHRKNFMDKKRKSGAIANYVTKDGKSYWVAIFSDVNFDKEVKKLKKKK